MRVRWLLVLCVLLIPGTAFAIDQDYIEFVKVLDGDTVKIKVNIVPPPFNKIGLRVYGVDTPESTWRAKCDSEKNLGLEAKSYVLDLYAKSKNVEYKFFEYGKYAGRVLGDVIFDGKSLHDLLIAKGYARPYFGEKKSDWCN